MERSFFIYMKVSLEKKKFSSERVISCQSGADVALTRKSHRWVVLYVRPIGGVD